MKISSILCGYLKLDGGAMFGVVPKRLWAGMNPPDDNNLCTWAMRALLVQTPDGRNILVDTGIGNKQDAKFRSHFEPTQPELLFTSLAAQGVQPDDITDVLLTHLHFDHCGGALWHNAEDPHNPTLSFPKAKYWTNRPHWDWAMNPNARERASFLKENFAPLYERGALHFVDTRQHLAFAPGVNLRFFNGHTEAMMGLHIQTGGRELIYCADLIPSRWHIGEPYVMAYDVRPLQTLAEKMPLLAEAAERRQALIFEHDPGAEAGEVSVDAKGRIALAHADTLKYFLD